jgi:hypothetical protein
LNESQLEEGKGLLGGATTLFPSIFPFRNTSYLQIEIQLEEGKGFLGGATNPFSSIFPFRNTRYLQIEMVTDGYDENNTTYCLLK